MNDQNALAVVYLTHNHPQIVEDVLENCAEYYRDAGVDIYFFDSSDGDETEVIVDKYIDNGNDNIFYISLPGYKAYEKMLLLFSGKALKKHYKYIWPSKDRAYVSNRLLNEVIDAAEGCFDVIVTFNELNGRIEYNNAAEFYRDYANWITSINLTIYNTESVLMNFNIALQKYYCEGSEAFLQISAVFYGLAQIDAPRIRIVEPQEDDLKMSYLGDTIDPHSIVNWKDHWIKVNEFLPDIYSIYKAEVIKSISKFPWILEDVDIIIELKEKGEITSENLDWVLDGWERISNIPPKTIIEIVEGRYDIAHDVSLVKSSDEMIGLLKKMYKVVDTGDIEQIVMPVDAIFAYFINKINSNTEIDRMNKRIITGSFMDVLLDAQKATDKSTMMKYMQEIIVYLLLI